MRIRGGRGMEKAVVAVLVLAGFGLIAFAQEAHQKKPAQMAPHRAAGGADGGGF